MGYHYFIRVNGRLEVGRKEEVVGAHCKGYNKNSIGICLAGLTKFSSKQFNTLQKLLDALKERYPTATLHGHREFNPHKTCPVFDYSKFKHRWNGDNKWNILLNILRIFRAILKLLWPSSADSKSLQR